MTLRTKSLLIISATLLVGVSVLVLLAVRFLQQGIETVEAEQVQFRMQQVQRVFWGELESAATAAVDWGEWDEAVRFLTEGDEGFGRRAIYPRVMQNLRADAVIYFDRQRQSRLASALLPDNTIGPADDSVVRAAAQHLGAADELRRGIIAAESQAWFYASSPVRHEHEAPVGWVVILRRIDSETEQLVSQRTRQTVRIAALGDASIPQDMTQECALLLQESSEHEAVRVCPLPADQPGQTPRIAGYTVFRDLEHRPLLAARIDVPRTFREQHRRVALSFTAVMAGIVVAGGVLGLLVLQTQVVRRVQWLASSVRQIAVERNWARRVQMRGNDELNQLSTSVNDLLTSAQAAEAMTREQEARFRMLFDAAPFPVVVSSLTEGRVLRINQRASEIFGVASEQAVGHVSSNYYHDPDDRRLFRDRIASDGQVNDMQVCLKRHSGELWWALLSGKRIVYEGQDALLVAMSDITPRVNAENALRASEQRLANQSRALTELTAFHSDNPETDLHLLQQALEIGCQVLACRRASAWVFTPGRQSIQCIAAHDPSGKLKPGLIIERHQATAYFEALDRRESIASNDAAADPRTGGFAEWYLKPNGITSMLDIPLRRGDEPIGVFCCEHIGPMRQWASDEQHFALSVGNLISMGMTERYLRESRQRLRHIVDTAHDAFVAMDARGQITDWNAQAERVFGWRRDEAMGRGASELLVPPELRRQADDRLAAVIAGEGDETFGQRVEMPALHKDGYRILVEITISRPIQSLDQTYFGAFIRDITERKRQEQELRDARTAAEAAARAKSAFLANMSHELRTPLNGVLGYAQILLRDADTTPRQRENLQSIAACGEHLLTLINDVLDLSRIEAGQIQLFRAECRVSDVVESTAAVIRPRAEQKGLPLEVTLEPGTPERVISDERRLRQVLVNLLSNAVKFTFEGSIRLRVWPDAGGIGFEVADSGIGIEPENLEAIFDAFKQTEQGSRHGGTGLGLAISRELVFALGGTLSVESQVGRGSRFWFVLPVAPGQGDEGLSPRTTSLGLEASDFVLDTDRHVSVLIADDQPTNREVLRRLLEDAGFHVLEAADGLEALRELRRHKPHAALVDLRMPHMDGLQLARAIRADEALRALAVVAVTASVFDESRQALLAAGCDEFIAKPVRGEELLRKLAKLLDLELRPRQRRGVAPAVTQSAAAPIDAAPADVAPPMPELAARLRAAAAIGNVEEINAVLQQADAQRGRGDPLLKSIREALRVFEFERIARLADALAGSSTP